MRPTVALTLVLAVCLCCVLQAQTYDTNNVLVNNFVGSGFYGHVDGQGELTMFNNPGAVVADSHGNLVVLDAGNSVIRKVTTNGVVTTFAGGGQSSPPGYGTNVSLGYSLGSRLMIIDHSDQIWIVEGSSSLLRLSPDSLVRPVGFSPAGINGFCVDSANRLYLACNDNRIYRYDTNLVFNVFVGSDSELGRVFVKYSSKGQLVPDDFTVRLWRETIQTNTQVRSFQPRTDVLVLDGIPRSVHQAQMLKGTLDVRAMFWLKSKDIDALVERMQRRALKENRLDDLNIEVIRERLETYEKETRPLVEFYGKRLVRSINADLTPLEVCHSILGHIKRLGLLPSP